jgi:phage tail-like protein
MDTLANYIPSIYLESDTDGSMADFVAAFDDIHNKMLSAAETLPGVNQAQKAPLAFQDHVAAHFGNPFPFMTSERWADGAKAENLVCVYSLRGTAKGMQSAIRYFCGVEATVLQDFQYCWKLTVSALGAVPSPAGSTGFGSAFGASFGS